MPGPGTWEPGDILTAADLNAIGTWTSYTPVVTADGTRTVTVDFAKYSVINKFCLVTLKVTLTNSGSANSKITVSIPVNMDTTDNARNVGSGYFFDTSANDVILFNAIRDSASTVRLFTDATTSTTTGLGSNPALIVATGDVISMSLMYETV